MIVSSPSLRALGGGKLSGNRIVRLVYVDEAGISNPKHEPFVVVAGAVIHADNTLRAVERYLDRLIKRHIPEKDQKDFVFHAAELFNGGGKVFVRSKADDPDPEWPLEKRLKIADELALIPKKFKLPLALGFVERANFPLSPEFPKPLTPRDRTIGAHVTAFGQCCMLVELWMRRNASNEICMMIVEDNDQARTLIRETLAFNQTDMGDLMDEQWKKVFPFRKIKEDPLFQKKRTSSALQVADFCAYVFKKILMEDERYERFYNPMRKQVIIIHD